MTLLRWHFYTSRMIARVLRRFAHLDDGLDVPWESPESCRDIGELQLRCSFQKLLKELLVFAVKDRLLCAVVHVEDLEEDAEDDGNDDEVEHVGRLHLLLLLLLPGQNGPNPVPICPKTPHPRAALPPQLSPRPDSRKGRSSSRACRVNFSNVAFLNRASLLLSLYHHHQPLLLVSEECLRLPRLCLALFSTTTIRLQSEKIKENCDCVELQTCLKNTHKKRSAHPFPINS